MGQALAQVVEGALEGGGVGASRGGERRSTITGPQPQGEGAVHLLHQPVRRGDHRHLPLNLLQRQAVGLGAAHQMEVLAQQQGEQEQAEAGGGQVGRLGQPVAAVAVAHGQVERAGGARGGVVEAAQAEAEAAAGGVHGGSALQGQALGGPADQTALQVGHLGAAGLQQLLGGEG